MWCHRWTFTTSPACRTRINHKDAEKIAIAQETAEKGGTAIAAATATTIVRLTQGWRDQQTIT